MSIYKDLINNIDDNGFLSHKFDITKYYNKVNASYNVGGADAFYIFNNKFDNIYKDDNTIVDIINKFKKDYDVKKTYKKLIEFLESNDEFLIIYNIDYINEFFIKNKKDIEPEHIYKLSQYIIKETNNIELLKLGIYFLCQFDLGKIDEKIVLDLALCDEFTFYCLFYGIIKFKNSNELIFNLVKRVYGIGRLFLIDQLRIDNNEKREYLVLNCNLDTLSSIGISKVIGTKINLNSYVLEKVNGDIYIGLSNIINSIVFDDYTKYNNYEELFNNYLDRFYEYSNYGVSYFVLTNMYNYINDSHIKDKVYSLVSSRKFKNTMIDYIDENSDINLLYEITYLLCNIESFGLEKNIYKVFITDSYKYIFMMDLLIDSKYRDESLSVLFENFKFDDGEITNSINENSIISLKNKYVLNLIDKYPYCNNDFIIKSLFSKYFDIRHNTMNVIYDWNRESDIDITDTSLYDKLIELQKKESSVEIKNSISELLDLKDKFKGTDKIITDNNIDINYKNIFDLDDSFVSFNKRRNIILSCIKNDDDYTVYILGNNKLYRVDCIIDNKGSIDSIKSDNEDSDIEKLFVLYYLKDKYYR